MKQLPVYKTQLCLVKVNNKIMSGRRELGECSLNIRRRKSVQGNLGRRTANVLSLFWPCVHKAWEALLNLKEPVI